MRFAQNVKFEKNNKTFFNLDIKDSIIETLETFNIEMSFSTKLMTKNVGYNMITSSWLLVKTETTQSIKLIVFLQNKTVI